MKSSIEPGLYRHYKGGNYEVIGIALHSETQEELVVYRACYQKPGEDLWVRPLNMFSETVTIEDKKVRRFTKV